MQRDDGVPAAAELEQDDALSAEDGRVALVAVAEHGVELGERERPLVAPAVGVPEVGARGEPGLGVRADVRGDGEGLLEDAHRVGQVVEVVEDDAHFVEEERVRAAERVRGREVLVREGQVAQLQVLHAQEELRQVRALEEAGGGAVGGHGLVVLALEGEGMREADPGRAEVRVHHRGLGEEAPRLGDLADGEVVDAHGEPGGGFFRVQIGEAVGEEEEGVFFVQFVQAGEVEGEEGEVVLVGVEDGGGDCKGLLEAALGEEELGFGEEEVRVRVKVVVLGEGFDGVGEFRGVFVFG